MTASAPEVSVLLPVRDGARWLDEAMASLQAQTFGDFEIIVVDDGSRDATPTILSDWADRDARVRVVSTPPRGIVPALETARERARAPYLARMDADDRAHPERLERQLAKMRAGSEPYAGRSGVGDLGAGGSLVGCGCGVRYVPESDVAGGAQRYQTWINSIVTPDDIDRAMFVECPLAHPTFFLNAAAVESVGGYRDEGWPEDYDLILRLWEAGGRFAKVPDVLLDWRERPDRLSRTDDRYSPAAFRRCKVHYLDRSLLMDHDGVVLWGAGPVGKAFSRELQARGHRVRAFAEVDPRKIGQHIHGAPVLDTTAALGMTRALHLTSVGQPGVREHLGALLSGAGLVSGRDFVHVA